MTITAVCSSCGRRFEAPQQFAGKRVKCKSCGTIFQIPAATAPRSGDDTELEALEQLERSAAGTDGMEGDAGAPAAAGPSANRIGPKLEKKLRANPDAEEIAVSGPVTSFGRANIMPFRYPGAKQVDQWLPLGLLLLGLVGLAGVIGASREANDLTWISISRFLVVVLFYLAIVFPITLTMLSKAAAEMRYRMPPNPKLRTLGVYMPAFALAACFWFAGNGSLLGLILGLLFGLALSSAALWLLFRLRESELATSVSYGAGGFALGAAISIGLLVGLNFLSLMIVNQAKGQEKVPASPFSPGLAWVPPPPPAPKVHKHAPEAVAVADAPTPTSPVVSDLQEDKIPFAVDSIVRPLSQTPIVGVVHTVDNFSVVEPWNTLTMERAAGTELRVSPEAETNADYIISPDGKTVAWYARYPRSSVKVWSFEAGQSQTQMIVLDEPGTPRLMGFVTPTMFLVRWEVAPAAGAAKAPDGFKSYLIKVRKTDSDAAIPLAGLGNLLMAEMPAVSTATQRLAAACLEGTDSEIVQYDLNSAKVVSTIKIDEVGAIPPVGLAYSKDGSQLAALYEYPGGALLLAYDAKSGKKVRDFVYTVWPPQGISSGAMKGQSAIVWLDSSNLLLYGQGILDTRNGSVVANLSVAGVTGQRVLDDGHVELLTNDSKRITVAGLDREKLNALLNPPATQAVGQ